MSDAETLKAIRRKIQILKLDNVVALLPSRVEGRAYIAWVTQADGVEQCHYWTVTLTAFLEALEVVTGPPSLLYFLDREYYEKRTATKP